MILGNAEQVSTVSDRFCGTSRTEGATDAKITIGAGQTAIVLDESTQGARARCLPARAGYHLGRRSPSVLFLTSSGVLYMAHSCDVYGLSEDLQRICVWMREYTTQPLEL